MVVSVCVRVLVNVDVFEGIMRNIKPTSFVCLRRKRGNSKFTFSLSYMSSSFSTTLSWRKVRIRFKKIKERWKERQKLERAMTRTTRP